MTPVKAEAEKKIEPKKNDESKKKSKIGIEKEAKSSLKGNKKADKSS